MVNNQTAFTSEYQENEVIHLPVAHGEGNYYCDEKTLQELKKINKLSLPMREKTLMVQ